MEVQQWHRILQHGALRDDAKTTSAASAGGSAAGVAQMVFFSEEFQD
jgi:hypothetical protein